MTVCSSLYRHAGHQQMAGGTDQRLGAAHHDVIGISQQQQQQQQRQRHCCPQ